MKVLVLIAILFSTTAFAGEYKCDFSKKQDPPRDATMFEGAIEKHLDAIGRTNTHVLDVTYTESAPSWKPNAWATICNGIDKTVSKEPFFLRHSDNREFWYADQFMSQALDPAAANLGGSVH